MKVKLTESELKQIITKTVKKVLTENYDNIPQILRLDPSSLNDDELKYCCKFLSANADEYTFNESSQAKFNSFFDEWKNRNSVIGESHVYDDNYPMEVLNSIEGDVEDVLYSLKNCESKTRIYSEGGTIKKYDENLYNLLLQIHEQCVQNIEFFENVSKIINK